MKTQSFTIHVSEEKGNVSAECIIPHKPICILVLAHGAGAGMNHIFMLQLANTLAQKGIATLRFNFPFMENKKGPADKPVVAHKPINAPIMKAQQLFPSLPLLLAGKSFGGRMSSQYLAEHHEINAKGIIFYGFPLHPAGKPSVERAEHLKNVQQPMLFLQGTKDELAKWDLIEPLCKSLKKATLVKIDGADHSFKAGKKDTLSILIQETYNWVKEVV